MTFAEFLAQLTRLLDGDEISESVVTTATLLQIVSLGERRVYREVRSRFNEKAFDIFATGNLAPIPADYEAPSIVHLGASTLNPVTEAFILDHQRDSITRYYAQAGANLTFAGPVADGTEIQGRYYCRLPALSATTIAANALFQSEPDLFVFACLSQAATFYGQLPSLPVWEAQFVNLKDTLNSAKQRAAYSSGRLQMRPSARIDSVPNYTPAIDTTTTVVDGGDGNLDGGTP